MIEEFPKNCNIPPKVGEYAYYHCDKPNGFNESIALEIFSIRSCGHASIH